MDSNKKQGILKWSLILSIIIVINLFLNIAVDLAYERPDYNDFCSVDLYRPMNSEVFEKVDYKAQEECREKYDQARDLYERNVFITLIIIGVIILGLAFAFKANTVLVSAMSLSAVLNFIIASMRYWGSAHELTKLIILAIALASLITIAYKKFSDKISN
jgi:uncharacterized protein (DUF983 family)